MTAKTYHYNGKPISVVWDAGPWLCYRDLREAVGGAIWPDVAVSIDRANKKYLPMKGNKLLYLRPTDLEAQLRPRRASCVKPFLGWLSSEFALAPAEAA